MRKKDPSINENVDITSGSARSSADNDINTGPDHDSAASIYTIVKNASASGLGSMGRSDEKLNDQSDKGSGDTY